MAGIAALGVFVVAPPASAASVTLTADCSAPVPEVALPDHVVAGDTVIVNYVNCPSAAIVPGVVDITGTNWTLQRDFGFARTYTLDSSSGTVTFLVLTTPAVGDALIGLSARIAYSDSIVFVQGAASMPPTPEASVPIPSWVQAFGRRQAETCPDGWAPSWQKWAEPVTGGWVCTRSIPSLG